MSSKSAPQNPVPEFKLPPNLTIEQQIVMCIGQLVCEWAICESVIRGLYVTLTGGVSILASDYAEVAWLSTPTAKGRCDLLSRTTFASPIPETFKDSIATAIKRFKGVSKTRNFFCHASYKADPNTHELVAVESYELKLSNDLVVLDKRLADITMVHSLLTAITNCTQLNRESFGLVLALRNHLNAQFPTLPELPGGYAIFPASHFPHSG